MLYFVQLAKTAERWAAHLTALCCVDDVHLLTAENDTVDLSLITYDILPMRDADMSFRIRYITEISRV